MVFVVVPVSFTDPRVGISDAESILQRIAQTKAGNSGGVTSIRAITIALPGTVCNARWTNSIIFRSCPSLLRSFYTSTKVLLLFRSCHTKVI